jgi:hypothetical protein
MNFVWIHGALFAVWLIVLERKPRQIHLLTEELHRRFIGPAPERHDSASSG